MAIGVAGESGLHAQKIAVLARRVELELVIALLLLMVEKIALLMAQIAQKVENATKRFAQVRY